MKDTPLTETELKTLLETTQMLTALAVKERPAIDPAIYARETLQRLLLELEWFKRTYYGREE